ncbi:MAG: hypothetical protein ACXWAC_09775 [Usitatibacter sp.]
MPATIDSVESFYAHALAVEHEAAERYAEFAAYFEGRGEDVLAGLCRTLEQMERDHYVILVRASQGMDLPPIAAGCHCWLDAGPPEAAAHELFFRITNPRQVLEIALGGERHARQFFRWVALTARDAAVRTLAKDMVLEEGDHIRFVLHALEYREPTTNWRKLLAHGVGPGIVTAEY